MEEPVKLVRSHGLGNDYLVLESGETLDPELVVAICDRHRGVGSDGLLEPVAPGPGDYGVQMWNPDGSQFEKSGNGLRIYARWLHDNGAPDHFTIWTGTDLVTCDVGPETIAVEMGTARFFEPVTETVRAAEQDLQGIAVDMGNPHFVVWRDEQDLDVLPWRTWGRALEIHPRFVARTNVQFARVSGPQEVEIRIWERGAGETLASGSSCCAVVASGVRTGRLQPGEVAVRMPGGTLHITLHEDYAVDMRGPVEVVGRIELDPRWLATRNASPSSSSRA